MNAQQSRIRLTVLMIGAVILAAGALTAMIAGSSEIGYIQCIANSGAACTSSGNTQYLTVFLASSETLGVGMDVALIGTVILIGGIILSSMSRIGSELRTAMAPVRLCPKCGMQVTATSKFCGNCGNPLA